MNVPMFNAAPALKATAHAWRANLAQMFTRMQFILGEQLDLFEREFAREVGAKFAVGVGSGTAALELSLRATAQHTPRTEVITSALTSPFTAIAIRAAGCRPRFADVDPDFLQLDAADAGNRATANTAALMPVHLYGQPCDLPRFAKLAKQLQVTLLQDACQAHGARFRGRVLTRYSACVAYSFYPTKNLGALGDGGAVVTDHPVLVNRLRLLRDGGRKQGQVSWVAGTNSRLDEMQCCYLRAFLPHLGDWNERRARLASIYDKALNGCEGVRPIRRLPCSVNHLYVVRAQRRNKLREFLAGRDIATGIHYPVPLHLQPAFRDCGLKRGDLPHAEKACREILSLPLWPYLRDSEAVHVAETVREFYRR